MAIFNPLLVFTAFKGNLLLFSFLIGLWLWLFFLFISNKFNLFSTFLNRLQKFFSRRACLYFLGNGAGNTVPKKLGWAILSPVIVAIPSAVGFAADADYKAANA